MERMNGTNITDMAKSGRYTIKIYTTAPSGHGGDLLELEKTSGDWLVIHKGTWME
jgi:hypothetical protein